MPVATGPLDVMRMLVHHTLQQPTLLCPSYLRGYLRTSKGSSAADHALHEQHAAALLAYCLQDTDVADPESCKELLGDVPAISCSCFFRQSSVWPSPVIRCAEYLCTSISHEPNKSIINLERPLMLAVCGQSWVLRLHLPNCRSSPHSSSEWRCQENPSCRFWC
jgi:hypothetical protein